MTSSIFKFFLIFTFIQMLPQFGFAQNRNYQKQTCKSRLQGTWELTESNIQMSIKTSIFQEVVIEFSRDSVVWIDALFGDTLVGSFYAWTDIVEVTESVQADPFCDDFDDDDFNDCEYDIITTSKQQNFLRANLNSISRGGARGLNWKNFSLNNRVLTVNHVEDGRVHQLVFTRRK